MGKHAKFLADLGWRLFGVLACIALQGSVMLPSAVSHARFSSTDLLLAADPLGTEASHAPGSVIAAPTPASTAQLHRLGGNEGSGKPAFTIEVKQRQANGQGQILSSGPSGISDGAYPLLAERVTANQTRFYVYHDADSGFNHGFPSGLFGTISKIHLDTACIDDPSAANGCTTDPNRLDRERSTVLRIAFDPLTPGQFAGVNIEEPEHWGVRRTGMGYDLRDATHVAFEVRSPGGISVQFGVGGCVTEFVDLPPSATYTPQAIPLGSLRPPLGSSTPCPPDLQAVHLLFTVVTNDLHAPNGGTILLDNIRFEPVPISQRSALSFPLSTETFGVVPLQNPAPGCVSFPPDQILRNLTTTYESALTLLALLARGTAADLAHARVIADTFDYALYHDNHGDPLPVAPDGSVGCFDGRRDLPPHCGLHNGYMSGDIALFNDQVPPAAGRKGDVRLPGFSCGIASTGFCLLLDGATGGNNAFAILALVAAYKHLGEQRYVDDARAIGGWIVANLTDPTGTGYGGYYLGYPDEGIMPKTLITGKSVENNADIFAAFTMLAAIEQELGNSSQADEWIRRANIAGDFVMAMFDAVNGRFYAGTVPAGTPPAPGIQPDGPQRGSDVINTFDFLDSNTFTTLALAAAPRYRDQIDWRRPVQFVLDNFTRSVTVAGQTFNGFSIVKSPTCGPDSIAWEFTGQAVVAMRFVDRLYQESRFQAAADLYLSQMRQAQTTAPFGDGQGLVASTLQDGDRLRPLDQCLSTPFQCIPERVGLAATTWAIFADRQVNPLEASCLGTGPYRLWGPVRASAGGRGLRGVTLTLNGPSSCTATTTTRAFGFYQFRGLANGTYMLTPNKAGCSFSPPSQTVIISGGKRKANFTATCQ